jgi:hypothetical protein
MATTAKLASDHTAPDVADPAVCARTVRGDIVTATVSGPLRHGPRDEHGHDARDEADQQYLVERQAVDVRLQLRAGGPSRTASQRRPGLRRVDEPDVGFPVLAVIGVAVDV